MEAVHSAGTTSDTTGVSIPWGIVKMTELALSVFSLLDKVYICVDGLDTPTRDSWHGWNTEAICNWVEQICADARNVRFLIQVHPEALPLCEKILGGPGHMSKPIDSERESQKYFLYSNLGKKFQEVWDAPESVVALDPSPVSAFRLAQRLIERLITEYEAFIPAWREMPSEEFLLFQVDFAVFYSRTHYADAFNFLFLEPPQDSSFSLLSKMYRMALGRTLGSPMALKAIAFVCLNENSGREGLPSLTLATLLSISDSNEGDQIVEGDLIDTYEQKIASLMAGCHDLLQVEGSGESQSVIPVNATFQNFLHQELTTYLRGSSSTVNTGISTIATHQRTTVPNSLLRYLNMEEFWKDKFRLQSGADLRKFKKDYPAFSYVANEWGARVGYGQDSTVKLLKRLASRTEDTTSTPLYLVMRLTNWKSHKSDPIKPMTVLGVYKAVDDPIFTLSHAAASFASYDSLVMMMYNNLFNPNCRDSSGLLPIHYAIVSARQDQYDEILPTLTLILESSAAGLDSQHSDGFVALQFAFNREQLDVLELFFHRLGAREAEGQLKIIEKVLGELENGFYEAVLVMLIEKCSHFPSLWDAYAANSPVSLPTLPLDGGSSEFIQACKLAIGGSKTGQ
ncbi:hypothetical protein BJ508DRAFT_159198 [Ascobolus immersus RN42]|uniref:Uncharacterized protein n=1 Tax=Ascobolus immersus RN42 TaxID=1160509 RepID=A0A3N4IWM3_ASCIM|nr:hypothetical protein BJ508DRAFT_159198 [Ascobolus immersus RN42]